ncbi:MAG TPA: AMP-binding protein [Acidimicrobiia bacterium]|nr:AMP-binding protein [Acidimicrobiia bacterium]
MTPAVVKLEMDLTSLQGFNHRLGSWSASTPQTAQELERWQLDSAWSLAEHLATINPYYRERLRLPKDRDRESFAALPLTRKGDVVADCERHPPFGSRTVVAKEDVRMVVQTSGTSGMGVEVYALNQADLAAILQTEAVGFAWAGIRAGTRVLLTLPIGVTAAGLWYFAALRALGANVLAVGSYPTERKVETLARFGAEVIVATPSYLSRLATACEDAALDPARLGMRSLIVAGEAFSHQWAGEIQERWQATLYEQYGCTERAIAWTCPGGVIKNGQLGVLHFPPESGYYEVIDPETGTPVGENEDGELVVTPFGASASPLLRYATGDRVRWIPPGGCPCSRPLRGIAAGAVQRWDDMMKIRGINVWPAQFDAAVFAVEGITDYRGVVATDQRNREIITIRLETTREGAEQQVVHAVRNSIGLRAQVVVEPPGTLAREVPPGFVKIRRWQDARKVR